ncbi:MAG: TRAP transporter small permease subunit [Burkholderiaceae bacterium]|nr:TRAP transporter small permease subunit [Burkholderiaceae bacterium]
MNALTKSIERVTGSVGIAAAMVLVPLVLATCYEVFARYAMGAPTIWAYEVGYLLTGSHFLLGMAYTLREDAHIRIDVFSGKFSERTRAAIDLVGYTVMLPLLIWLSYQMYRYLVDGYRSGETSGQSALNLPVWPFRVVFLVAFVLFALQVIVEVTKCVRRLTLNRGNAA